MNSSWTNRQGLVRADWFNFLLGLWVIASPFALGFTSNAPAMWNNVAVGGAVLLITWISGSGKAPFQALIVPLATWLFWSPFCFMFQHRPLLINNISLAFVLMAAGAASEFIHESPAPGPKPAGTS